MKRMAITLLAALLLAGCTAAPGKHPWIESDLTVDQVAEVHWELGGALPEEPRRATPENEADRERITRLLEALTGAKPVSRKGPIWQHDRMDWLVIELKDGRHIAVRRAWECDDQEKVSCRPVPGEQVIVGADGPKHYVVSSPELEAFLTGDWPR